MTTWGLKLKPPTRQICNCTSGRCLFGDHRIPFCLDQFCFALILLIPLTPYSVDFSGIKYLIGELPEINVLPTCFPSGASTDSVALPQDQGVALEDPQSASRVARFGQIVSKCKNRIGKFICHFNIFEVKKK